MKTTTVKIEITGVPNILIEEIRSMITEGMKHLGHVPEHTNDMKLDFNEMDDDHALEILTGAMSENAAFSEPCDDDDDDGEEEEDQARLN